MSLYLGWGVTVWNWTVFSFFFLPFFFCVHSEHSYNGNTWMSTADPDPELPHPSEHHLELSTLVSLETDSNQEEGRETIVFLWILNHVRHPETFPSYILPHTPLTAVLLSHASHLLRTKFNALEKDPLTEALPCINENVSKPYFFLQLQ